MNNRKSPRAQRFDYTASAGYFVTICTKDRLHYFGEITDGEMELNKLGLYCTDHRNHISDHYPFVVCDAFICMPNHIHGILIIGEHTNIQSVGTQFLATGNGNISSRTDKNPSLPSSRLSGSLGSIIRGFKIGITKYATANNIPFARQSRYHDHIIRNEQEYERLKYYIQTNPENREKDCFADL